MNDSLGDWLKAFERRETGRVAMPRLPVYARIDGRSFSSFTQGMDRPFDARLSQIMIEVTAALVCKANAVCGYTQSDEISLAFYAEDPESQIFFRGKLFKMTSVLAAMASVEFFARAVEVWPERVRTKMPVFDCRVFELPSMEEAANAFLWREIDATKNAVSMAASSMFSHRELEGKSGSERQEMMWQRGVNFNDYPVSFKRGTFVQRRRVFAELPSERLERIPEAFRPGSVERSEIRTVEMPPFRKVANRAGVIFRGEEPILVAEVNPVLAA